MQAQSTWREVERQLIDFFRSEGGEIESVDGETYLTVVLLEAVPMNEEDWQEERQCSLSALARLIASDSESADTWKPLGAVAAQVLKKVRAS
jgi:hypothetical protein